MKHFFGEHGVIKNKSHLFELIFKNALPNEILDKNVHIYVVFTPKSTVDARPPDPTLWIYPHFMGLVRYMRTVESAPTWSQWVKALYKCVFFFFFFTIYISF